MGKFKNLKNWNLKLLESLLSKRDVAQKKTKSLKRLGIKFVRYKDYVSTVKVSVDKF